MSSETYVNYKNQCNGILRYFQMDRFSWLMPALMHGFYTVDGYANSYPLEYKYAFRQVMEKELEKDPISRMYYDLWGSRCYLFNSQTGTSYMNGKNSNVNYENLEYDWKLLKNLGCDYIFSCGEIVDHEKNGLRLIGDFESDTSYWHIWVYELRNEST